MTVTPPSRPAYPASWADHVLAAVQRLPLPYGLTYLLAFALESLVVHAAAWLDGTFPPWVWQPILLLFPLRTWLVLALMTHLNHAARRALYDFRVLLGSDEEAALLETKLTTLPRGPVWIATFLGCGYFLFLAGYRPLGALVDRPLLTPVYLISGLGAFGVGGVLYYQTYHQLRIVQAIYAGVRSFNLFRLEPVYAFSHLTARTSGAYLLLLTLTLLLFPYPVTDLRAVVSNALHLLLSGSAFALPLWRTHQRLAAEKRRLQAEVERRLETALASLHRHLDDLDPPALAGSKTAVESLLLERKVLTEIPTWPWQPGTLRGLLTAFLLPLVLLLAQLALERWLRP